MSFAPNLKMRGSRQGSSGLNGQRIRSNGSSPGGHSKTSSEGTSSAGKSGEAKHSLTALSTKKSRALQASTKSDTEVPSGFPSQQDPGTDQSSSKKDNLNVYNFTKAPTSSLSETTGDSESYSHSKSSESQSEVAQQVRGSKKGFGAAEGVKDGECGASDLLTQLSKLIKKSSHATEVWQVIKHRLDNCKDQEDAIGILAVSVIALHFSERPKSSIATYIKIFIAAAVLIGMGACGLSAAMSSENFPPPV